MAKIAAYRRRGCYRGLAQSLVAIIRASVRDGAHVSTVLGAAGMLGAAPRSMRARRHLCMVFYVPGREVLPILAFCTCLFEGGDNAYWAISADPIYPDHICLFPNNIYGGVSFVCGAMFVQGAEAT